jgi:sulfide:quinone oxidoreductase
MCGGFEADKARTGSGEIPADLVLFIRGMTQPDWLANADLPKSEGGFAVADAYCHVSGLKTQQSSTSGAWF